MGVVSLTMNRCLPSGFSCYFCCHQQGLCELSMCSWMTVWYLQYMYFYICINNSVVCRLRWGLMCCNMASLMVFPALCEFTDSPQINCRMFKWMGQHGFPQPFQSGHESTTENFWAEAITAHIQSHLSQQPNEGAFVGPDWCIFTFYDQPSSKQLALLALERDSNTGLFALKHT